MTISVMSPFFRFYRIALQDAVVYRWNILFAVLGYSLTAFVGIHIAQQVYGSGYVLGNYSLEPLLAYFLLILAMDGLLYFGDAWNIVDEIHTGKIVNFLVKPISYYSARVAIYLGKVTIRFLTLIPALVLGTYFLSFQSFSWLEIHFLAFLPYFFIGLALHICLIIILGVLSFPLDRSSAAIFTLQTLIFLTGGKLLPLTIFPEWAQQVMAILPFHFMTFTPLSWLLGQETILPFTLGLVIDLGWLCLAIICLKILWRRGMKTYEGFGQ